MSSYSVIFRLVANEIAHYILTFSNRAFTLDTRLTSLETKIK